MKGWLYNKRSSGKIQFLIVRDGTGYIQCVVPKADVPAEVWEAAEKATQECSLEVAGTVREEKRAPGGYEMTRLARRRARRLARVPDLAQGARRRLPDEPAAPLDALLAAARGPARALGDGAGDRATSSTSANSSCIDSPILTGSSVEGTSTLFETDYFGDKAYLSQSGQLYLEPAAAAFGKVYCFGPTFRAEKSKTRRHLTEFWMVEPEVAFLEFEGLCELAEDFIVSLVGRALERCRRGPEAPRARHVEARGVAKPFPRITYRRGHRAARRARGSR